jgi:hypothetical protein
MSSISGFQLGSGTLIERPVRVRGMSAASLAGRPPNKTQVLRNCADSVPILRSRGENVARGPR